MIVNNALRPERRALRTALSPTDCADRLRSVTASPLNPWSNRAFSGRVSSERFSLTQGSSRMLMKAVARGEILVDGAGTLLRFQLGPDLARVIVTVAAVLIVAGYMAVSIYRIPVFGHVLPPIPARPGSGQLQLKASPFLAIGGVLLVLAIERPFVRRHKMELMRRLIGAIDGRVASPTS
jgi:ABC-type enterochelin transport system permease subunit